MSINIKEILPSDSLASAIEKMNFNFDQLILAGGGPVGPIGGTGDAGVPGEQGIRGNVWFTELSNGVTSGISSPTSISGDLWLGSNGDVWEYGTTGWIFSGENLRGATGNAGAAGVGGAFKTYKGSAQGGGWKPTLVLGHNVNAIEPDFISLDYTDHTGINVDNLVLGSILDLRIAEGSAQGYFFNELISPRLQVLQTSGNVNAGISIGIGGTYSTVAGTVPTNSKDWSIIGQSFVTPSSIPTLEILSNSNAAGRATDITINSIRRILNLQGGGNQSAIYVGGLYDRTTNVITVGATGNDVIIKPNRLLHIKGDTYFRGGLYIKGDVNGTQQAEGMRIYRDTSSVNDYWIKAFDNTGFNSESSATINITTGSVKIDSKNKPLALNTVVQSGNLQYPVVIGTLPSGGTVGTINPAGIYSRRWSGILGGDSSIETRFYVGKKGSTINTSNNVNVMRSGAIVFKDNNYPTGAANSNAYRAGFSDTLEFRMEALKAPYISVTNEYTAYSENSISIQTFGAYRMGYRIGRNTGPWSNGTGNNPGYGYTQRNNSVVSLGGKIHNFASASDLSAGYAFQGAEWADRLNIWGGIRFKGTSLTNNQDDRVTNIGYSYADMVFVADNQNVRYNPSSDKDAVSEGFDMTQDTSSSKIWFNPENEVPHLSYTSLSGRQARINIRKEINVSSPALTIYATAYNSAYYTTLGHYGKDDVLSSTSYGLYNDAFKNKLYLGVTDRVRNEYLTATHGTDLSHVIASQGRLMLLSNLDEMKLHSNSEININAILRISNRTQQGYIVGASGDINITSYGTQLTLGVDNSSRNIFIDAKDGNVNIDATDGISIDTSIGDISILSKTNVIMRSVTGNINISTIDKNSDNGAGDIHIISGKAGSNFSKNIYLYPTLTSIDQKDSEREVSGTGRVVINRNPSQSNSLTQNKRMGVTEIHSAVQMMDRELRGVNGRVFVGWSVLYWLGNPNDTTANLLPNLTAVPYEAPWNGLYSNAYQAWPSMQYTGTPFSAGNSNRICDNYVYWEGGSPPNSVTEVENPSIEKITTITYFTYSVNDPAGYIDATTSATRPLGWLMWQFIIEPEKYDRMIYLNGGGSQVTAPNSDIIAYLQSVDSNGNPINEWTTVQRRYTNLYDSSLCFLVPAGLKAKIWETKNTTTAYQETDGGSAAYSVREQKLGTTYRSII